MTLFQDGHRGAGEGTLTPGSSGETSEARGLWGSRAGLRHGDFAETSLLGAGPGSRVPGLCRLARPLALRGSHSTPNPPAQACPHRLPAAATVTFPKIPKTVFSSNKIPASPEVRAVRGGPAQPRICGSSRSEFPDSVGSVRPQARSRATVVFMHIYDPYLPLKK